VRRQHDRSQNLTDARARLGWSDAVGSQLKTEEARLAHLKATRSSTKTKARPTVLPSAEKLAGYLEELVTILSRDAARGQALPAGHIAPVVLTPDGEGPDRHYRLNGALNILACLRRLVGKNLTDEVVVKNGSGGLLAGLVPPALPFRAVAVAGREAA
jgi:hypothetical protein